MGNWFDVDKEGLAAILKRRGVEFALFELVSNALDTRARNITVTVQPVAGRALANVSVVDDDPEGFKDLTHAFTLFAPSEKKGDLKRRGRFNLGEKLVLAICDEAVISSTTGTIAFTKNGRTNHPSKKRASGSGFAGVLRMTHEESARAVAALRTLLVSPGVHLNVSGERVLPRERLAAFEASLATEVADADGNLKRGRATAVVSIYEPRANETPMLYEMGIPVVETGDRWHVNVEQKVPLNMDRDNVPAAFLRELRTHVLNAMHSALTAEDASEKWVREATSSPDIEPEAFKRTMELRFGEQRVSADPSDREAENIAKAKGYTIVSGGAMTAGEWENARRTGALLPAGKVTPSPKPFSADGKPLVFCDAANGSERAFVAFAERVGRFLVGRKPTVSLTNTPTWGFAATWGRNESQLIINIGRLGRAWFVSERATEGMIDLLIHEFAHDGGHHLEEGYHDACTRFGARLVLKAIDDPNFFLLEGSRC